MLLKLDEEPGRFYRDTLVAMRPLISHRYVLLLRCVAFLARNSSQFAVEQSLLDYRDEPREYPRDNRIALDVTNIDHIHDSEYRLRFVCPLNRKCHYRIGRVVHACMPFLLSCKLPYRVSKRQSLLHRHVLTLREI
jgi:hypothetical protein